jgi:hypothetical protein
LQQFTGFALDKSENIQPPMEWAACDGLKGTEKVYPASHLTMYVKVRALFFFLNHGIRNYVTPFFLGRSLGTDGAAEDSGGISFNNQFRLANSQGLSLEK